MLKLSFSKPSVKVYMDGKITVCTYNCTIIDTKTKEVIGQFKSSGTAKCSPNDVINFEWGRKLADSRAKKDAYKVAASLITFEDEQKMIETINSNFAVLKFANSMRFLKRQEEKHIKYICNEILE